MHVVPPLSLLSIYAAFVFSMYVLPVYVPLKGLVVRRWLGMCVRAVHSSPPHQPSIDAPTNPLAFYPVRISSIRRWPTVLCMCLSVQRSSLRLTGWVHTVVFALLVRKRCDARHDTRTLRWPIRIKRSKGERPYRWTYM